MKSLFQIFLPNEIPSATVASSGVPPAKIRNKSSEEMNKLMADTLAASKRLAEERNRK